MNHGSRGDRKKLSQALGEKKVPSKPESKEEKKARVELAKEFVRLVDEFAEVDFMLKAMSERRDQLKARAIELSEKHGVGEFKGSRGAKVQVIRSKARMIFDKKEARQYLTEEQYKRCEKVGKTPAPTVKFVLKEGGDEK